MYIEVTRYFNTVTMHNKELVHNINTSLKHVISAKDDPTE